MSSIPDSEPSVHDVLRAVGVQHCNVTEARMDAFMGQKLVTHRELVPLVYNIIRVVPLDIVRQAKGADLYYHKTIPKFTRGLTPVYNSAEMTL